MARQLSDAGIMLPVIRKVICRDGCFICSICRSEYQSRIEANNCLNACWLDIQDFYPIVLHKLNLRKIAFRCQFCCRDYLDESLALACARRCLSARNNQHIKEQLVNDLPIVAPVRKSSRLRLIATRPSAAAGRFHKSPPQQSSASAKDPNSITTEPLLVQPPIVPESRPAHPEVKPIDTRRTKASFPKQWIRNDARYQCKYCNSLFFTKMETETCFHSHFDEQGFEILAKK